MVKLVCSVCGYIYDESKGIPAAGIAPGTTWENITNDWVCPLCGAPKSAFEKQDESAASPEKITMSVAESSADLKEMSALEISALCTNLARGCEKQYQLDEAVLFRELAGYFKTASAPAKAPDHGKLIAFIEKDLKEGFPNAHTVASEANDRGALRALVWSEKVTRILKSLLTQYQIKGESMYENTDVYVCTICGFIFVGNNLPDICPVCKVPNWKFEKIEGRQ